MALRSAVYPQVCNAGIWGAVARAGRSLALLLYLGVGGLSLSCGDFILFPDGPGTNPNPPTPTEETCENPFSTLSTYEASTSETLVDGTLVAPIAVAVVPAGMGFPLVSGGVVQAQAEPGDIVVAEAGADALQGAIYVYHGSPSVRYTIPVSTSPIVHLGGIALYHDQILVGGVSQTVDLLLFTALGSVTPVPVYDLFAYDLKAREMFFIYPEDFEATQVFVRPTAVAVGKRSDLRGLFVLNNGTQLIRLTLTIDETGPVPGEVVTLAQGFTALADAAFFDQTGNLYLSEVTGSLIYRIENALTRSPISQLTAFIPSTYLQNPVGLALAPTDQTATTAALLVFNQVNVDAIRQFDPATGGAPKDTLDEDQLVHLDLAYDCTNTRLVLTRKVDLENFGLYQRVPR